MAIIERLFHPPQDSYFLFGPRGTGKSTFLAAHYPDAFWINLLDPEVERAYTAYPERLKEVVAGNPQQKYVVIDEVQRAPALLSVVHLLIEEKHPIKFILTGSSARKLKQTEANLLAGRAVKKMLYPFMGAELGESFSLEKALQFGLLPLVHQATDPAATLSTYLSLYIKEEVQAEGLVRDLGSFSRFLEAISFSHGSILNVTNISRECSVKRKTVENYLQILEDLMLSFQIPVFTQRAKRDLIAHPKFYIFDVGVYRALRPSGPLDTDQELNGAGLEGLVAQHLRAWIEYTKEKYQLYYWRTRAGVEVDLIVYGEQGLWAIEVKNKKTIDTRDLKGLKAFKDDYPVAKALLLYRGNERLLIDDILCIPCEEFLRALTPNEPLS